MTPTLSVVLALLACSADAPAPPPTPAAPTAPDVQDRGMRIDITLDDQLADLQGTVARALEADPLAEITLVLHPSISTTDLLVEVDGERSTGRPVRSLVIEGARGAPFAFERGRLSLAADAIELRNLVFRGAESNEPVLSLTATRSVLVERVAILDAVRQPTWDPTSKRSGPSAARALIRCAGAGAACTLRDVWVSGTTSERAASGDLLDRGPDPGPLAIRGLGLVGNQGTLRVNVPADAARGLACDHQPGGLPPDGVACPKPDWDPTPARVVAESAALRALAERAAPIPDPASLAEGLAPDRPDMRKPVPGQEPPPTITTLEQWPPHDPGVAMLSFSTSEHSGRHRHGHDSRLAKGRFTADGLHLEVHASRPRADGRHRTTWSGVVTGDEAEAWARALRSPHLSDRARSRGGTRRTLSVETPDGRHGCSLQGMGELGTLLAAALARGEPVGPE